MRNDSILDFEREGKPIHTMFNDAKRRGKFAVTGTLRFMKFADYCNLQGYEIVDMESPHYNGNVFTGKIVKVR